MFCAIFVISMSLINVVAILLMLTGVMPNIPYLPNIFGTRTWYTVIMDLFIPLSTALVTESAAASVYVLAAVITAALDSLKDKLLKKDTLNTADVFVTARQFDSIADCGRRDISDMF